MKNKEIRKNRIRTTIMVALYFMLTICLSTFLIPLIMRLLVRFGMIKPFQRINWLPYIPAVVLSIIAATVLTTLVSRSFLLAVNEIVQAIDRIAAGDFSVRVQTDHTGYLYDLTSKFNRMAAELQSVELLRTGFINDFSHEFKTPIVSIRGFAKMLLTTDLPEEEKREYLQIILSESDRLSDLSVNVLNLSRLENQSILTNRKDFSLSEQLRLIIALLQNKWTAKDLEVSLEGPELEISGDEEMLRQLWINLLDNAIKFSAPGSKICICTEKAKGRSRVEISNPAPALSEDALQHLFDKFYQADPSHTTAGNGLGLSIAKRICELHEGSISVRQEEGRAVFSVEI